MMKKIFISLILAFAMVFSMTEAINAESGQEYIEEADKGSEPEAKTIELNTLESVTINENQPIVWFKYECTDSDTYTFLSSTDEGYVNPYGAIFIYNEYGNVISLLTQKNGGGLDDHFAITVNMLQGKTYYFAATLYEVPSYDTTYGVQLYKNYLYRVGWEGLKESLTTIEPVEAKKITLDQKEAVTISVNDTQESWFTYTPGKTGVYAFYSDNTTDTLIYGDIYYYDENKHAFEEVSDIDFDTFDDNLNFIVSATLKKGITYYLGTTAYLLTSDTPDFSYTVSLIKDYFEIDPSYADEPLVVPSNPSSISLNKSQTVELSIDQPLQALTFTPKKSGTYAFYSTDTSDVQRGLFGYCATKNGKTYKTINYGYQTDEDIYLHTVALTKGVTYYFVIGYGYYNSLTKPVSFHVNLVSDYAPTKVIAIPGSQHYENGRHEFFINMKVGDTFTLDPKYNTDANPLMDHFVLEYEGPSFLNDTDIAQATLKDNVITAVKPGIYYFEFSNSIGSYYELIVEITEDHLHTFGSEKIDKASKDDDGSFYRECQKCDYIRRYGNIPMIAFANVTRTSYTYDNKVKKPNVVVYNVLNEVYDQPDDDATAALITKDNYSVSYSKGRINVGTYTVTIKFKNLYKGTLKVTFKINPKGTKISKVTKAKKAFTVKWKKQTATMNKHITGYQIQYSTSSKFKSGNKTKTVKGYKKSSKKITGLKAKKKYYVRLRTYSTVSGKKYYSSWSTKKSVKTK